LLKKLKYSNQLVIYLGSISAFIYAIHPIVRMVFLGKIHPQTMLSIFLYLLISILLAMAYKPVHGMICKLLNKAKDKKE
jgi:peptidoglycan/LPS O-acetylase OafA/YrhL